MTGKISQHAIEWLASAHVRPTRQRLHLAQLLVGDGQDRHVTAEWLHAAALKTGERISLATVYNTLKTFTQANLLQEIKIESARSYFDTRTDSHPHFFWEAENRLSDAPMDALVIDRLPEPPAGTEISKVDVVIRLKPKKVS